MKKELLILASGCIGVVLGITGLTRSLMARTAEPAAPPSAESQIQLGKHLIQTSGCNDCHTPGFMQNGEKTPESAWLTGVPLGWRGPWGTSYASNLRRHLAAFPDAAVWISMVRSRNGLPPMPWPSLHAMTDAELRAIHAYIRSLPVTGEAVPPPLPPDKKPATPYLNMEPVMPD